MDLERYRPIIEDWSAFAEASARPEPTVFRVRSGRVEEGALVDRLAGQGFRTRPIEGLPGFHVVEEGPRPLSSTFEHWNGLLYVQQASTGTAAPALGPRPGERVLDLCAAPGGKTTHMAELMGDTGCLVASEISESRIRGLLGNVYRLGHTNVAVVAADGREFPLGGHFDRVLVDAPCSGEGTLRRRGGRAPRQSRSFQGYVTSAQRDLLERAVRLTRPGGVVLYVTCTFAPEENEAVVSEALARLPVELEPLDLPVPHARGVTSFAGTTYDPRVAGAARIYPHHLDSGGLFLARLRRLDGDVGSDGTPGRESAPGGSASEGSASAGPTSEGSASAGPTSEGSAVGWTSVARLLPDELREADGARPLSDDTAGLAARDVELAEAESLIETGVTDLRDRFGVGADLAGARWMVRGGRAWLHTIDAWPLPAWTPGAWRPVSVGLRAVEFDSRGRARPTNDLLRWLDGRITDRAIDVETEPLTRLLQRQPLSTTEEERGPWAVRYRNEVVGRVAVTGEGIKSEIPKARAKDLLRCLSPDD